MRNAQLSKRKKKEKKTHAGREFVYLERNPLSYSLRCDRKKSQLRFWTIWPISEKFLYNPKQVRVAHADLIHS